MSSEEWDEAYNRRTEELLMACAWVLQNHTKQIAIRAVGKILENGDDELFLELVGEEAAEGTAELVTWLQETHGPFTVREMILEPETPLQGGSYINEEGVTILQDNESENDNGETSQSVDDHEGQEILLASADSGESESIGQGHAPVGDNGHQYESETGAIHLVFKRGSERFCRDMHGRYGLRCDLCE